jgi:hypothetical protein
MSLFGVSRSFSSGWVGEGAVLALQFLGIFARIRDRAVFMQVSRFRNSVRGDQALSAGLIHSFHAGARIPNPPTDPAPFSSSTTALANAPFENPSS